MKKLMAIAVLATSAATASVLLVAEGSGPGAPVQPIAFDHWQHVTKEEGPQLECSFCHQYADESAYATIPPVDTCVACHESVKSESPEVQKLVGYRERGDQPPWARVYWIEPSANTFFSHKPHVQAGVECRTCHGDVANAHTVRRQFEQTMGWCIQCHKERGSSTDCYTCHR